MMIISFFPSSFISRKATAPTLSNNSTSPFVLFGNLYNVCSSLTRKNEVSSYGQVGGLQDTNVTASQPSNVTSNDCSGIIYVFIVCILGLKRGINTALFYSENNGTAGTLIFLRHPQSWTWMRFCNCHGQILRMLLL